MSRPTRYSLHLILFSFCCLFPGIVAGEDLQSFSQSFWTWRSYEQPFTTDDIPRIERPTDFSVDWSAKTVTRRRAELNQFEERWMRLTPPASAPIAERVDYRLLGSALARVRWELDIVRSHSRNPLFYVDQTLGSVYVLLLPPPPFSPERARQLIARMSAIPATVQGAEENLTDMRQPFVRLAITALQNLPERCRAMNDSLAPQLSATDRKAFRSATDRALPALEQFSSWLKSRVSATRQDTAIGRENYLYFLHNIALMPFSPDDLLQISKQEWSRTVAFESFEAQRDAGVPARPMHSSQKEQMEQERADEGRIRAFLQDRHILTIPAFVRHYRNLALPPYVEPFSDLGVTDDLTGASRLSEDGTSYIPQPGPTLGFFSLASAHDPRPIIVHEGVPGHYLQLCLSWAHPNPIRRHYYDSGANEGIGFYAEEMMLQAGLFDDSPHTREAIYSFMRLRALRVEVDVKLALGDFTLQQAADYLHETVPMDKGTALEEASLFASTPGQAISYQIGKSQILELLADVRRKQGVKFDLRRFHDALWTNGNVPIALQRWELLGDAAAVPATVAIPAGSR